MNVLCRLLAGVWVGLLPFAAHAQPYPSKAVRIVVSSAPGGPIDTAARVIGEKLSAAWQQPVTIDNRPGAGEIIGTELVSRASPDGYTLLMVSLNVVTINPVVFAKLPYDPLTSFASVALTTINPMVLVANNKAPFNTVKELIEAAKARPGEIAFSSPGLATSNHIAAEWLAAETGMKLFHIPYKGGPAAATAILSGDVPFGVVSLVQALPLVKGGTAKALAVTTAARSALAPDWPTIAEAGVPGFDAAVRAAMFAPAGTPRDVIARLNTDVNRILAFQEVRDRFAAMGVEPAGSTPAELDATIATLRAQIERVVASAKIKVQ
ncbi:MAG: Bug family tripartite tricarboxylate transporter substrate binding protein [Burkholderiales bacterium]